VFQPGMFTGGIPRKTPPLGNLLQAAISGKSHTVLLEYKKKSFEPAAALAAELAKTANAK